MLNEDFKRLVIDLTEFYGKADLPPAKKLDKWFEKMENIPSECREFLYDRITDEYSRFPENLPKAAWKYTAEWKDQHPEKYRTREFLCTQEACDAGMLGYFKPEGQKGLWIPFRCRCGHCTALPKDWPEGGDGPKLGYLAQTYTVEQIEANGWIVADSHGSQEVERLNKEIRPKYDADKYRRGVKGLERAEELKSISDTLRYSENFHRLTGPRKTETEIPF